MRVAGLKAPRYIKMENAASGAMAEIADVNSVHQFNIVRRKDAVESSDGVRKIVKAGVKPR